MGNSIYNDQDPDIDTHLDMSNGLTSVFLAVLLLNLSPSAKTEAEIALAQWLASRDQSLYGIGVVGFDIGHMPWSVTDFAGQKQFLLDAADAATRKMRWELLDYQPREDWVLRSLETFKELIAGFDFKWVSAERYAQWQMKKPATAEICPTHGVHHHWEGCIVCLDV